MNFLLRPHLSLYHITILLCIVYMLTDHVDSQTIGSSNISCIDSERQALFNFKKSLVFDSKRNLSDWSHENMDCCRWEGIRCSKAGHVVAMDLHFPWNATKYDSIGRIAGIITGEISSSLVQLPYLNYLDLSNNGFTKVPDFIGSLKRLRYLNLSHNPLMGKVPHQLGNLSVLETLDLGIFPADTDEFTFQVDSLAWVSRLTSLEYLDMSYASLNSSKDWLQSILTLPSLTNLYLTGNNLPIPPPIQINASTSLEVFHFSHSFKFKLIQFNLKDLAPLLNDSTKLVDLSISDFFSLTPFLDYFTKLESIKYLDLSGNDIEGILPEAFGNLSNLITLDLSSNSLEGIPETLSNLSNLITLDVSYNMLNKSFSFLQSGSNSLEELNLFWNQQQGTLPNLSKFPSLQVLNLGRNEFKGSLVQLLQQSSNLIELDVSSNHFNGTLTDVPTSKFSTLQILNLAGNEFSGNLAKLLQQSFHLIELDVSSNHFNGTLTGIPFSKFSALQVLNLAGNEFEGSLPHIQQNSNLIKLDVSSNHFSGTLTEALFQNLTNLQFLSLSGNSLTLSFSTGFTPPFQLQTLNLSDCKLGKIFPHWLRTQNNLRHLEISNSGISDATPSWFWNISSKLDILDVSHNSISGSLPPNPWPTCLYINLGSNRFHGTLPSFSKSLWYLLASNNSFSGEITSLCGLIGSVSYLDLSNNFLSGVLPNCFDSGQLSYLILNNNKFTGSLPNSMGNAGTLTALSLQNNGFSGNLPQSLQKCTSLTLLDLGENHLSGTVPDWIGTNLTNLVILRLRSNNFEGNIPSSLCHLKSLQILDLSDNHLAGIIPSCLDNLTSMMMMINDGKFDSSISFEFVDEMSVFMNPMLQRGYSAGLFWKGVQMEYNNVEGMKILRYIDLSNNTLSGLIPEEVTSLVELDVLRLSHNVLFGRIPSEIGKMRMLETLDLSHNYISGEIPSSMVDLSTLNYLDLSYNNLMGRIPVGTQLSTMNATMFLGNEGLCGDPLPKCHHAENVNNDLPNTEGGDDHENMWMYISIILGFIVGFWGVCGTLLVNHSWAQKYFQFLIHIHERLHVTILIGLASLRRRFAS